MRGAYATDDPWHGYRQTFRVFFREAYLLSLHRSGIQSLLYVVADQEAAPESGALTHLACQRFACVRAGPQPRRLLPVVECVAGFLSLPGVIAILRGRTRVTRHGHAPWVIHPRGSIIGASGWVVSSLLPATSVLYAVHRPTGNMGTRSLRHVLL
jgi:hypothetical protein